MHAIAPAATSGARHWRPPSFSTRFYPVWQRNLLVWRKLAVASVLGNIADPLLYMLALGYGIGALIGEVGGMPYVAFIGTGMVCQSAMFTASFEGMYSAFSRMHVQRTWDAIINAPIALDDVMLAEWTWCATKALMSTIAILLVLMALGYGRTPFALAILPIGFLIGLVFGAFGLVMNALAPGYDFFTYFFTLVLTPMLLLSGVYFPVEQLPALARRRRRDPAAQARDRPGAAADARSRPGRDPAARRRAGGLRVRRVLRRAGAHPAPAAQVAGAGASGFPRMNERFFAPCPRGLEAPLGDELAALGAGGIVRTDGGVAFEGPLELACRANLESRLASRILWRVGGGRYRDERDVHALAKAVAWPTQFRGDRTLRVDVAATRSPLTSLEFATLTVKDAVCDRFRADTGGRPSVDKRAPDVRVHVHLTADTATIYLDTSGEPLFKRGWRRDTEEAPLRENLAAGLLALAGWRAGLPLLDPMCGSGTIAIEAALLAANRAPGLARTFGFQKLAWYDGPTWQRMRQKAPGPRRLAAATARRSSRATSRPARSRSARPMRRPPRSTRSSPSSVRTCSRASRPAPEGVLVSNPPYGARLSDRERLAAFYPRLGDALKQHFAGWHAWLFSGDPASPSASGFAWRGAFRSTTARSSAGSTASRWWRAGTARRPRRRGCALAPRAHGNGLLESTRRTPLGCCAMPMLPSRNYESEHTKFIRELLEQRPELRSGSAPPVRPGGTGIRATSAKGAKWRRARFRRSPTSTRPSRTDRGGRRRPGAQAAACGP